MSWLAPMAGQGILGAAQGVMQPVGPGGGLPPLNPVVQQALQQYPILQKLGIQFKSSPGSGGKNMLESWLPGETGTKDQPRPQEFDPKKLGIEIYSDKTKPSDILADVVSHHLVNVDPNIKNAYQSFQKSLTPKQQDILQDQYQYAKKNEGETRPFDDWAKDTGIPAFFRGYAFKQWPDSFNAQAYTPQQKAMFDKMIMYLQSKQ